MIVTHNYAFSIATTAQGLLENNSEHDFIFYILHDGINIKDKEALKSLLVNVVFIDFSNAFFHQAIGNVLQADYDFSKVQSLLDTRKFYFIAKVYSLELLKKHDSVLYLDTDLLIQGSLSQVFNTKGVAWRGATASAKDKLSTIQSNKDYFSSIPSEYSAPNAGVMFFSRDIPYEDMIYECYWVLQNYHLEMRADLDEAVIAWSCYKYKVNLKTLNYKYNQWSYSANDQSIILHAIGNINFWDTNFRQIIFYNWSIYYKKWIDLGGSEFKTIAKDSHYLNNFNERGKLALTFEYMLFWEQFYQNLDGRFPEKLYRSGPVAKEYSKLLIRGVPKHTHYEVGVHSLGGQGWVVVKFFVKQSSVLKTKLFLEMTEYLAETDFHIVDRGDMLEICSQPVSVNSASSSLYKLSSLIDEKFPQLYDLSLIA